MPSFLTPPNWRRLVAVFATVPLALLLACPPEPPAQEPEPAPEPGPVDAGATDGGFPMPLDGGNEPEPAPVDGGVSVDAGSDGGTVNVPVDGGAPRDGGGACDSPVFDGPFSDAPEPPLEDVPTETMMTSSRGHVVWKRARQLRNELTDCLLYTSDAADE